VCPGITRTDLNRAALDVGGVNREERRAVVSCPGRLVQYAGAGFYYQILVQTTGRRHRNLAVDGTRRVLLDSGGS